MLASRTGKPTGTEVEDEIHQGVELSLSERYFDKPLDGRPLERPRPEWTRLAPGLFH